MDELYIKLYKVLADSAVLSTKLQNCHWNITGLYFYELHLLFERLYKIVSEPVDRIAENLRSLGYKLGYKVDARLATYLETSDIEEISEMPAPGELIKDLIADVEYARLNMQTCNTVATTVGALGINNMLGELHEQYGVMLFLLSSNLSNVQTLSQKADNV